MSPEREFSIEVIQRLRDAGFEALWAGGCVRDSLLGREPGDYDVATSATPKEVAELFRRTLNVGASFGVMIVLGKKEQGQIEVATFRSDGEYVDGRRPKEVTFCSAELDAQRRDFTINGMFYDPIAEQVIDYVGGQEDLKREVIRAIGEPRERFEEDKLRLLRAVRFAARFDFAVEEETADAIGEMAPQLTVVSAERIAQELHKMLEHPNRAIAIRLAREHGLLSEIFPEVAMDDESVWQQLHDTLTRLPLDVSFDVALSAVLQSANAKTAGAVCRRLRLANKETDATTWLVGHQNALDGIADFDQARLKRLLAQPLIGELITFIRARAVGSDGDDTTFAADYLERTPADEINPQPVLTGDDLVTAGFKPGPEFKKLLDAVRDAQLNGEIDSTEAALDLAKSLTS